MSVDGIFLRVSDSLIKLTPAPYDTEDVLQAVLADFPEVLVGPTTEGDATQRLVLVTREAGVPQTEGGADVFSLDHLFLDSAGVPVLVEVKRSTDTRIRREVVGQMLDYASNAARYWSVDQLQGWLEASASRRDCTADEVVEELAADVNVDAFWRAVDANLRAGRIRMIFVADALPPTLVRIIEFLNEQMTPAEVLGVELRQYVNGDHVAYVPRVIGQTVAAVGQKSVAGNRTQWDDETFRASITESCSADEAEVANLLMNHVLQLGGDLRWSNSVSPGVTSWYREEDRTLPVWSLYPRGYRPGQRPCLYINFRDLLPRVDGTRIEAGAALLEQVPSLAGAIVEARQAGWAKYPRLDLADVGDDPERLNLVRAGIERLAGTQVTS